jgi:hypothetical protein
LVGPHVLIEYLGQAETNQGDDDIQVARSVESAGGTVKGVGHFSLVIHLIFLRWSYPWTRLPFLLQLFQAISGMGTLKSENCN